MSKFILGLDLGQAADFTALAVLESAPQVALEEVARVEGNMTYTRMERVEKPTHFHIRHLERYDLGTRYPSIVAKVAALLQTPQLRGATLTIDATGCGRPVYDMFVQAGLKPKGIVITGGNSVNFSDGFWHTPKRDLISAVVAPLQNQRLKFAESLALVPVLIREMLNFKVKISDAGHDSYAAWRETEHDDLVLALALACWWAQRPVVESIQPSSVSMRTFR